LLNRELLNQELTKVEKPAGIANPKDFRNECVMFILRMKAENKHVKWTSYEKLRKVIERKMFANVEELLPVISFGAKKDKDDGKKHDDFVFRMKEKGYTEKQVRRAVEWYMRTHKA
jgi:serine protein kinase